MNIGDVHADPATAWIATVGAQTVYIESGSPWENGYVESFNARLRDELLHGEIFYSLREAQILIEYWRRHYNTKRPHGALGYRPPVLETIIPLPEKIDVLPKSWTGRSEKIFVMSAAGKARKIDEEVQLQ